MAQLIEDGSTLQLGIALHAILGALGHRRLGLHTEMMSGRHEMSEVRRHRQFAQDIAQGEGGLILHGAGNSGDFVHENDDLEFLPSEYVNNPINIARNDRMVL